MGSLVHNLTKRVATNVRAARAEVSEEIISAYFDNLEQSLNKIPAENIFNYDETNVTNDPGSKTVVVRHGQNQIERKTQHSKTSTSIMLCGNAVGQFLPLMVVYKKENLYQNWVRGGPKNAVYEVTPSGWFDNRTFEIWFLKWFVPAVAGKEKVALIEDNLGVHFSKAVIDKCLEDNIFFICLPPNSIHLCQPLDVAVFRSAKSEWAIF